MFVQQIRTRRTLHNEKMKGEWVAEAGLVVGKRGLKGTVSLHHIIVLYRLLVLLCWWWTRFPCSAPSLFPIIMLLLLSLVFSANFTFWTFFGDKLHFAGFLHTFLKWVFESCGESGSPFINMLLLHTRLLISALGRFFGGHKRTNHGILLNNMHVIAPNTHRALLLAFVMSILESTHQALFCCKTTSS